MGAWWGSGAPRGGRAVGRGAPGAVSVVGSGDAPAAALSDPPLTTVRQPLAEKGRQAGELALRLLDGGRPGEPTRVAVTLVSRDSTAAQK